jgi:hypothetical protein
MEHRRHRNNRSNKRTKRSHDAAKSRPEFKEVVSIGDFRAQYLPADARQRIAHNMTPEEIGEDFARTSLAAAKEALN